MDKGFRSVRPLQGGLDAWIEAGGEIAMFEAVN
jgi:3-mercaptopyruvate sulfurtransferase SseA